MKRFLNRLSILVFSITLVALTLSACKTRLEPGGAYKEDAFLYNSDLAARSAYEGIHAFVKWEFDNRFEIRDTWPAVTKAADQVRKQAPLWWAGYMGARGEYVNVRAVFGDQADAPDQAIPLSQARSTLLDKILTLRTGMTNAAIVAATTTLRNVPQIARGKDFVPENQ